MKEMQMFHDDEVNSLKIEIEWMKNDAIRLMDRKNFDKITDLENEVSLLKTLKSDNEAFILEKPVKKNKAIQTHKIAEALSLMYDAKEPIKSWVKHKTIVPKYRK